MELDDEVFDIDNMDIEEQMNEQDIADEENEAEEQAAEKETEENDKAYKISRKTLKLSNLEADLLIPEPERNHYKICKKGGNVFYDVCVLHKIDNDAFIFLSKEFGSKEPGTMRKYRLSEIK